MADVQLSDFSQKKHPRGCAQLFQQVQCNHHILFRFAIISEFSAGTAYYQDRALLVRKGIDSQYESTLGLVKTDYLGIFR